MSSSAVFTPKHRSYFWGADIYCLPKWAGFLCFAVVLDVDSRRIIGIAMGKDRKAPFVINAMSMAVTRHKPDGAIHNIDQGSHYAQEDFSVHCEEMGAHPKTGAEGDCYDNALCEGVFATFEA